MKGLEDPSPRYPAARGVLIVLGVAIVSAALYAALLLDVAALYSPHRLLGWDTILYAFSGKETLTQGLPWLAEFWGHPNLYVMLLAAVSMRPESVVLLANTLPIAVAAALVLGVANLARRNFGLAVGVAAALLTITSLATFRLFVDLHRAILALAAVAFLLDLDPARALSKARIDRSGALALVLLFVVAFSEFEIYLVFFVATILRLILIREPVKNSIWVLGWLVMPGALFMLTPSGWSTLGSLAEIGTPGLPKPLPLDLALLFVPAFLIPFTLLGVTRLLSDLRRRKDGVSTMLLSWVLTVFAIFILLGFVFEKISPFRALLIIQAPLLAALGADWAPRAFLGFHRKAAEALPPGHFLRFRVPGRTSKFVFAITATSLVLGSGTMLYQNADRFLEPIVPDDLHALLDHTSQFIQEDWSEPIYLVLNHTYTNILVPVRYELGLANGPTYFYYGDINLLPWAVRPHLIDARATQNPTRYRTLSNEYNFTAKWLDFEDLRLLDHPIVIVSPELFHRTLPSSFEQYLVDPGLYVIPPNALSLETFLSWEILAVEDSFDIGESIITDRNWSLTGKVVERYSLEGYNISFPHYFPVAGTYSLAIHLFDFPSTDYDTPNPLSPLEVLVGDTLVDTLDYGRNEVIWWNVTVDLPSGYDLITLRAADDELPFRMSLDVIRVLAES